jgi:alpha-ribazole phosphatase
VAAALDRTPGAPIVRFVLVRHPQPAIAPGICYGRLDIGLRGDAAETVREIVSTIAGAGADAVQVWTSPAIRCLVVAETVARAVGADVLVDPRLQELHFGAWEGAEWNSVPRASLDAWAADPIDFAPPGGESGKALLARVRAVLQVIVATRQDCVIVSHGGPLKLLAALIRREPPELLAAAPPLGSVQLLTGRPRAPRIR